jgi:hypothetical protein
MAGQLNPAFIPDSVVDAILVHLHPLSARRPRPKRQMLPTRSFFGLMISRKNDILSNSLFSGDFIPDLAER